VPLAPRALRILYDLNTTIALLPHSRLESGEDAVPSLPAGSRDFKTDPERIERCISSHVYA
jgi:hypothetical protein